MTMPEVTLQLYIFIFLHQTTTSHWLSLVCMRCISLYSYIKPQLIKLLFYLSYCCISLYSYIKPQQVLMIPFSTLCCISLYSYIKPQLSTFQTLRRYVVYLYIPTSNHNFFGCLNACHLLYIFIFLHQTTT